MAVDTKKIVIEIIDGNNGHDDNETVEPIDKELNPIKNSQTNKTGGQVWLTMIAQRAINIVTTTVEASANRYFYMKEDYIGETMYHNVKNNIGRVSTYATTIGAGAKIGGLGGVAIATAGILANEGISIFNKYATLENQINTMNYGVEFNRTRSGLVDNGRGTEN